MCRRFHHFFGRSLHCPSQQPLGTTNMQPVLCARVCMYQGCLGFRLNYPESDFFTLRIPNKHWNSDFDVVCMRSLRWPPLGRPYGEFGIGNSQVHLTDRRRRPGTRLTSCRTLLTSRERISFKYFVHNLDLASVTSTDAQFM